MSGESALRHRWCRGVILALLLLVLGPAGGAQAHDELTGTKPADGAELKEAPSQVRLEFSGEVATVGAVVAVEGPLGSAIDGAPQVEGTQVLQPLITDPPPGEYAVLWRVTSADGHPISGEFSYTLAPSGVEAQGAPQDSAAATSTEQEPGSDQEGSAGDDAATTTPPSQTSGTGQSGSDRAADTAAASAKSSASSRSGTAPWIWGVLALALVTLGGLGVVAVRRR